MLQAIKETVLSLTEKPSVGYGYRKIAILSKIAYAAVWFARCWVVKALSFADFAARP
jgi:hypothetical protein